MDSHPTALSAQRTLAFCEHIAACWVANIEQAPASIADLVSQYRNLTWYADNATRPEPYYREMDKLSDEMVAAAASAPVSEAIYSDLPFSRKCDFAIEVWRGRVM